MPIYSATSLNKKGQLTKNLYKVLDDKEFHEMCRYYMLSVVDTCIAQRSKQSC